MFLSLPLSISLIQKPLRFQFVDLVGRLERMVISLFIQLFNWLIFRFSTRSICSGLNSDLEVTMNPIRKNIGKLTEGSGPYTVKVKVVRKWRPTISAKKIKFQKFVMQDEKGDEIQATVFGEDVDRYDSALPQHKEYEISNTLLKLIKDEFSTRPTDLQMHFNTNTVIRPLLHSNVGDDIPEYQDLSSMQPNSMVSPFQHPCQHELY